MQSSCKQRKSQRKRTRNCHKELQQMSFQSHCNTFWNDVVTCRHLSDGGFVSTVLRYINFTFASPIRNSPWYREFARTHTRSMYFAAFLLTSRDCALFYYLLPSYPHMKTETVRKEESSFSHWLLIMGMGDGTACESHIQPPFLLSSRIIMGVIPSPTPFFSNSAAVWSPRSQQICTVRRFMAGSRAPWYRHPYSQDSRPCREELITSRRRDLSVGAPYSPFASFLPVAQTPPWVAFAPFSRPHRRSRPQALPSRCQCVSV